jgi:cell division protein FtsQ
MPKKSGKRTKTKSTRKKGSAASKKARLNLYARRFGVLIFILVVSFWVMLWAIISGAPQKLYHSTQNLFYQKTADAGFVVEDLLVEGRQYTDIDVLRALLNVERGDPLLAFNPKEAKELIEKISWVETVRVERRMPATIFIELNEREPFALWQHNEKVRLIDKAGVVLTEKNLKNFNTLPIIVGKKAPEKVLDLFSLLNAEPELAKRIEAASLISDRRWDLRLKTGVTIKLPEKELGFALKRLVDSQEEDGLLDKDLKVIDVRYEDRIVVRTKPGSVREYKASVKSGNNI